MSESEKTNLDKDVVRDESNKDRMGRREFNLKALGAIAGITIIGVVAPEKAFPCPGCGGGDPDSSCGGSDVDNNCGETLSGGGYDPDNACSPELVNGPGTKAKDPDNNCGNDYDVDEDCSVPQGGGWTPCLPDGDFSFDTDSNCANNAGAPGGSIDEDTGCGDCLQPDNHDSDQDCDLGTSGHTSDDNCGDEHILGTYDTDENCGDSLGGEIHDHDNSCNDGPPILTAKDDNCGNKLSASNWDEDENCGALLDSDDHCGLEGDPDYDCQIGSTDNNCGVNDDPDNDCLPLGIGDDA